ncbi:glutamine--fructose-6-phosphate aminotransferase, partial [bacterium]|nr:glutamine--fructose-6-phosphate aminotransferase [bacterium]
MCGIIGYVGQRDVVPILVDGLKMLEYRGYDSAGIAVVDKNQIHLRRVKGKISDLVKNLKSFAPDGSFGVGHTRWATHGRPSEENAHPHRDCTDSLVVVHNGIIENYLALKKKLIKEKHTFRTETDTEVIAHLVEKHFHGSLEEAVQKAVQEIEGTFAIAVISLLDPGKIVVAKIGPPAVVGLGEGEYFVSSDLNPLLNHTQRIVFLEDGEIAVLDSQGAKFLSFQGKPLKKKEDLITWSPLMVEKRGFKHFMLKEIFEQPQVVRD